MKRIILIFLIFIMIFIVYQSNKNNNIIIPNDAIRFRILANSNSPRDQKIKEDIKNKMQDKLYFILSNAKDKKEAKTIINSNIKELDNILKKEMQNIEYSYKIDYGMHYFPEKKYNGIIYKEGNYESLLVTLGKGEGDNWWCVLFPPLCVLEAEESDEVEYKFFIKEIIEKYF